MENENDDLHPYFDDEENENGPDQKAKTYTLS